MYSGTTIDIYYSKNDGYINAPIKFYCNGTILQADIDPATAAQVVNFGKQLIGLTKNNYVKTIQNIATDVRMIPDY